MKFLCKLRLHKWIYDKFLSRSGRLIVSRMCDRCNKQQLKVEYNFDGEYFWSDVEHTHKP